MTEWSVRRWTRYGHDRLYASTPGGIALGYLDLATGRFHADDPSTLPLLQKAISDHAIARRAGVPVAASPLTGDGVAASLECSVPADAPSRVWADLSSVSAGAAARERALVERQAQGVVRHVLARLLGARTDERAWRIGADGERAMGAHLAKLGEQWRVLHAVRVGDRGADIDHVAIGPEGVFTINTKNHPNASVWVGGDTVMVNGRRVPYVRNSRYEATRASRILTEQSGFPVPVTGVVAVVGASRGYTVKAQPADGTVVVVPRRRIARHLQAGRHRLSSREVHAVYEVARRSTTWQR